MKDIVGLCPVCNKAVLIDRRMLYFTCPHCDETSSLTDASQTLEMLCANPAKIGQVLKMCTVLDASHGSNIPLRVLDVLQTHQPYNEDVAFMRVRLSNYKPLYVKQYLNDYSAIKRQPSYATEFLDKILIVDSMQWANQISQYIDNKLSDKEQKKYRDKYHELKSSYIPREITSTGMTLIYILYVFNTLLNVAISALMIFLLNWPFYYYFLLALGAFVIEIGLLFWHNRVYGNRIEIEKTERLLMVIFMCSGMLVLVSIAIGAVVSL